MKHIYFLLFACSSLSLGQAQNTTDYQPFPNDSIFFERASGGGVLLPAVKSNDNANLLMPINNVIHWNASIDIGIDQIPVQSWLGGVSQEGEELRFITALEDTIRIPLNIALNESDTSVFHVHTLLDDSYKLVTHYSSFEEANDDEIKTYSFELLDINNNAIDDTWSGFDDGAYDTETMIFRISKNNGILSSPSFYYFPYSQQYHYKDRIDQVLDQSTSHAYRVFHQNVGDEIHSEKVNNTSFSFMPTKTSFKSICVSQEYKETEDWIIRVRDVWKRIDSYTGSTAMTVESTMTVSFSQITDTIDLGNFTNLNKIVPDGLAASNPENNTGYFYDADKKMFVLGTGPHSFYSDGLVWNGPVLDAGNFKDFFIEGHSNYYYDNYNVNGGQWIEASHLPVYSNINGEEWGEPFTESFILDIAEVASTKDRLLTDWMNESIRLETDKTFESGSIYDSQGRFVKYIAKEALQQDISLQALPKGMYILMCWDGKEAIPYKFVK